MRKWMKSACVCIAAVFGLLYAVYMHDLHENSLWFSEIDDIEREVSLRGESAFYYHFYKKLVNADEYFKALQNFTVDTQIEHPSTVNILERFNVYQVRFFEFVSFLL